MMKLYLNFGLVIAVLLAASIAHADSLELKNGSLIKGKFMGGTESEVSFRVDSSVQEYKVADIVSLKFDSEKPPDMPARPTSSFPEGPASGSQREERFGISPSRQVPVFLYAPSTASIPPRTMSEIVSRLRWKSH